VGLWSISANEMFVNYLGVDTYLNVSTIISSFASPSGKYS